MNMPVYSHQKQLKGNDGDLKETENGNSMDALCFVFVDVNLETPKKWNELQGLEIGDLSYWCTF